MYYIVNFVVITAAKVTKGDQISYLHVLPTSKALSFKFQLYIVIVIFCTIEYLQYFQIALLSDPQLFSALFITAQKQIWIVCSRVRQVFLPYSVYVTAKITNNTQCMLDSVQCFAKSNFAFIIHTQCWYTLLLKSSCYSYHRHPLHGCLHEKNELFQH